MNSMQHTRHQRNDADHVILTTSPRRVHPHFSVGKSRYSSYCYETISLGLVFLMMSKEEGIYVQERPSYINVLGRMSTSGSEC